MSKRDLQPRAVPGYLLNVPTSHEGPFWEMHPGRHVCCALCGAIVRRSKFDAHLQAKHPDYDGELNETPPLQAPK
ncbi:MAG: hypothetical protein AAGA54_18125 [Myxococcota bacterium]